MDFIFSVVIFGLPTFLLLLTIHISINRTKVLYHLLPSIKADKPFMYRLLLFAALFHLLFISGIIVLSFDINPFVIVYIFFVLLLSPISFIENAVSLPIVFIFYSLLYLSTYISIVSTFTVTYCFSMRLRSKKKRKKIVISVK